MAMRLPLTGPVEKGNIMLTQNAWKESIPYYSEAIDNPKTIPTDTTLVDVSFFRNFSLVSL